MLTVLERTIGMICALWVYWDATGKKIGKVSDVVGIANRMVNISAGMLALLVMGMGILGLPFYLLRRPVLIKQAIGQPVEIKGRGIKMALLAIIGGLWVLLALDRAMAPSPQQKPVEQPASKIPTPSLVPTQPQPQQDTLPVPAEMPKPESTVAEVKPAAQTETKQPENSTANFSADPILVPSEPASSKPSPEKIAHKRAQDEGKRRTAERQSLEEKQRSDKKVNPCVFKPVMTDEDIERCR